MPHYRLKLHFKSAKTEAFQATAHLVREADSAKEALASAEAELRHEPALEWDEDTYVAGSEVTAYTPRLS